MKLKKYKQFKLVHFCLLALGLSMSGYASITPINPAAHYIPTGNIMPARLVPKEDMEKIRTGKSTTILFGRHATTNSNKVGVSHSTGADEGISATPEDSVDIVSLNTLSSLVSGVYYSPSDRCTVTAHLLRKGSNKKDSKKIEKMDPNFREHDFGTLTGKPCSEFIKDPEFFRLLYDDNYKMSYGGESMKEVINRILLGIDTCSAEYPQGLIYICTSRGCIAALEKYIKGLLFKEASDNQEIVNLYSIKNYHMLILNYYYKEHVIELLTEHPVSPFEALQHILQRNDTLIQQKASHLLEIAQLKSPAPSPIASPKPVIASPLPLLSSVHTA